MKSNPKFISFFIILFTIFWSFKNSIPTYNEENNTLKKTDFSIEKALSHVKNISIKPHYPGTEEHKNVQNYIVKELNKLGLTTEIQTKTVFNKKWGAATTVENIIATIKGTNSSKSLLLLSHYDSNPHSALGASDAGSGVATILEGVRALLAKNEKTKNDIVILLSDAEEIGLLGAKAFAESHSLAKNIGLILNFEARGSGGPSYMLLETNSKNSTLLKEFLKAKPNYPIANSLMYSIYKMLPNDTDLTVFRENNNINGFNFAFIGDHFDYHSVQDNYNRLDRASLLHQADYFTSTVNHFANIDLSNLTSTKDNVFVNFPFVKMIHYPFSWIGNLLGLASILFLIVTFIGLKKGKLSLIGIFKGFIPFLVSLILCGGITFLLWKLFLVIHPAYKDILHGFTYNGYQYIIAFVLLNCWILIKVYTKFKDEKTIDLLIAPITIWLLINLLIYNYIQGAGFFIIPVFITIFILAIHIFTNIHKGNKQILGALLSIPIIYIFSPLLRMFPVGLGLKSLFISAILLVLLFGLLIPVLHQQRKKILWIHLFGFLTILMFAFVTYNSNFSIDKKKPNSLVYIQNEDSNTAFWGTYNKTLDNYTKQIFDKGYVKGGIKNSETKSKYNTRFNYHKKTDFKYIKSTKVTISLDTIIDDNRHLNFTIKPERKINKLELFNNTEITIRRFSVNGSLMYENKKLEQKTIVSYFMANTDSLLKFSLICDKNDQPKFTTNAISYDLLTNENFSLTPRNDFMIPMPFVTNDAIICTKTIQL